MCKRIRAGGEQAKRVPGPGIHLEALSHTVAKNDMFFKALEYV